MKRLLMMQQLIEKCFIFINYLLNTQKINFIIFIVIFRDMSKIEEAIGDKIAPVSFYLSVFLSGLITGLVKGWELALICLIYLPVSMAAMGLVSWVN